MQGKGKLSAENKKNYPCKYSSKAKHYKRVRLPASLLFGIGLKFLDETLVITIHINSWKYIEAKEHILVFFFYTSSSTTNDYVNTAAKFTVVLNHDVCNLEMFTANRLCDGCTDFDKNESDKIIKWMLFLPLSQGIHDNRIEVKTWQTKNDEFTSFLPLGSK